VRKPTSRPRPPAHSWGTVELPAATPTGTSVTSTSDQFTYTAAAAPSISSVSPTSGSTGGGTAVQINGSNFTGASAVTFGTVAATRFDVLSDTLIVATSPPQAAATVDIKVTTPSGTSATGASDQFTYTAAAAPSVTGITPTSGTMAGGTVVTILGSNFTGASAVKFGTVDAATYTVVSDNAIIATSPLAQSSGVVD